MLPPRPGRAHEAIRRKRCLILDTEPYRYQKFISDIAGQDIRAHGGKPETALILTRNWLANVCGRELPGPAELECLYAEFRVDLPAIAEKLGLHLHDLQFVEYVKVAMEWLRDRQQNA
jgi:hypothetical protein